MRLARTEGSEGWGSTTRPERLIESAQNSSKNSGNDHEGHMDATSCQCMVVIMKYDKADNGRCNPGRRRENQERTRLRAPSQEYE